MEELKKVIDALARQECKNGIEKYGLHHSAHEGVSVLREEVEETEEELEFIKSRLDIAWSWIRKNGVDNAAKCAKDVRVHAINLSAEAVQVAAMAEKFIQSVREDEEND